MRIHKAAFLVVLLVCGAVGAFSQSQRTKRKAMGAERDLSPAVARAVKAIDAEKIREHVRYLADDRLQGRGTGQPGGDLAAKYIAEQFASYGLKPAGDNNTYLQRVPLVGLTTQPESTYALVPASGEEMKLSMLDDYVVMDQTQGTESDIDAPVVFVGYGISAPEFGWDDYKGANLKGKVLLMLVNEPPSLDPAFFKGPTLTYYGRWTYKFEAAARRGAVGAILIHKTEMASYGWNVVRNSWSGERSDLLAETPKLHAASWIQLEVARKALAAAGKNVDELMQQARSRSFRPVELPLRLKAHLVTKVRRFESNNVIAKLEGSDPAYRNQAVIYTAHYDHLGIRPNMAGDNIFNGAVDNATGCAALLEMARVFAEASQRPRRSILFAAVTAEEQGLLGSEYLGKHPPMPAARLVLNLNFDGIPPRGEPEEVEVSGAERTSFYPVVKATAESFGLEIVPDANPSAGYYYRSDHFSLARVGVPGFSVEAGLKFKGRTLEWGRQQRDEYTVKRYHQPGDQYTEDMDFTTLQTLARFGFTLGWKAALLRQGVEWRPGDEFEAARRASRKAAGAQ
ncbi:MAG TPA: M28 family peptidase [Terriglobales bacterium]|nr:M28 family peptidase [Terriglobales bacterium]